MLATDTAGAKDFTAKAAEILREVRPAGRKAAKATGHIALISLVAVRLQPMVGRRTHWL